MRRAERRRALLLRAATTSTPARFERSWLVARARPRASSPPAAIAALSDGFLHYYLGGTADAHLRDSPFKNLIVAMIDLADELELPLNLGGGLAPGDGLEEFKRGFANAELAFRTHEMVCDPAAYAELAGGREPGTSSPPTGPSRRYFGVTPPPGGSVRRRSDRSAPGSGCGSAGSSRRARRPGRR